MASLVLSATLADQRIAANAAWQFQLPANVFSDVDASPLTHHATLADDAALPERRWFDPVTRTLEGFRR
jgi:hypothetical protein